MKTSHAVELSRSLIDRGEIIEAGWVTLADATIPEDASQAQIDVMHEAFFAGAHHLFNSILVALDPGKEPTDDDERRMGQIQAELDYFIARFKAKYGSALQGQ